MKQLREHSAGQLERTKESSSLEIEKLKKEVESLRSNLEALRFPALGKESVFREKALVLLAEGTREKAAFRYSESVCAT